MPDSGSAQITSARDVIGRQLSNALQADTLARLEAFRRFLDAHASTVLRRLRDAHAAVALVKRRDAPDAWIDAVESDFATTPINISLMPLVLPDEIVASAFEVAACAVHSEEFSAFHRPVEPLMARAREHAWPDTVLRALLGDQRQTQTRLMRSFHRGRADLLFDLGPGDVQSGLLRLADAPPAQRARALRPIEVNNGGSQGHWLPAAAQALFLRAFDLESDEKSGLTSIEALLGRVYEQLNDFVRDQLGPVTFAQFFPRGFVHLAFISGPYNGRILNDIEGPHIAAWLTAHYGIEAAYDVGFEAFEVVALEDRLGQPCALLRRRGDDVPMVVWGEFYVTETLAYTEDCLRAADPRTRRVAQAVLGGEVLGVTAWPGREVLENDKTHACDKARAIEYAHELGLSAAQAALLQSACPASFPLDQDQAFTARVCDDPDHWVVKARFGCGGAAVIVGHAPSFPSQRLPRIEGAAGQTGSRLSWVPIFEIAQQCDVHIATDAHGRLTGETWFRLWPHLVRFAAANAGYYIAQHCIPQRPFDAMLYDGETLTPRRCHVDLTFAYTLRWAAGTPHVEAVAPLCRGAPLGYPHSNISARGGFVPLLSTAQFARLADRLGL